jgi:hypothetical protein
MSDDAKLFRNVQRRNALQVLRYYLTFEIVRSARRNDGKKWPDARSGSARFRWREKAERTLMAAKPLHSVRPIGSALPRAGAQSI